MGLKALNLKTAYYSDEDNLMGKGGKEKGEKRKRGTLPIF